MIWRVIVAIIPRSKPKVMMGTSRDELDLILKARAAERKAEAVLITLVIILFTVLGIAGILWSGR